MSDYLNIFMVIWTLLFIGFIILLFRLEKLLRLQLIKPTAKHPRQAAGGRKMMGRKFQTKALTLHVVHREDCICAGIVGDLYPFVIVADGVTEQEDPIGKIVTGKGGGAARKAVETAREYLTNELDKLKSVEEILQCLQEMYNSVAKALKQENLEGATTLLVAILWGLGDRLYWCYAYIGDGFINLLSPARKIEGIVLPERLLSAQKVEGTAAISQNCIPVPPAIGCRLYEPNDLIYVASDGLTPVDSWLRREHKQTLNYFLLSNLSTPENIEKVLTECPNYTDDAVLGIIWMTK